MGRFFSIGIATSLRVSKEQMRTGNISPVDLVEQLENALHYPIAIFDASEEDDALVFTLKSDVFQSELLPFLERFYQAAYPDEDTRNHANKALEALRKAPPSQWVTIAADNPMPCFYQDAYAEGDRVRFDRISAGSDWRARNPIAAKTEL